MVPCNCCRSLECPNMRWLLGRAGYQICKQVRPGNSLDPWPAQLGGRMISGNATKQNDSKWSYISWPIFFFSKISPFIPVGGWKLGPEIRFKALIQVANGQEEQVTVQRARFSVSSMDDSDPQWTSGPLSAKWKGDDIASRCFLNLNLG